MDNFRRDVGEISRRLTTAEQAERLRELEAENERLTRAVAVLTFDKLILEEVVEGNG